jgi:hypothetical protein
MSQNPSIKSPKPLAIEDRRRMVSDFAARLVWQDPEIKTAMAERLYRGVLTASAQPSFRSGTGFGTGSWPSEMRDVADHLGIMQREEGETARDVAKRVNDSKPAPRYQPTRLDLDQWLDSLALLEGFGLQVLERCQQALSAHDGEVAKLQARLTGLRSGAILASFEVREARISQLMTQIVKSNRHRKGLLEAIEHNTGLGRKAFGVLKGAGMVWFFGAPRSGLKKWDYVASWGNVASGLIARKLHDEAIYWALATEQLKREGVI